MGSGGFMWGRTTGGKGDYCMGNCTGVECSGEEVVMIDIVDNNQTVEFGEFGWLPLIFSYSKS